MRSTSRPSLRTTKKAARNRQLVRVCYFGTMTSYHRKNQPSIKKQSNFRIKYVLLLRKELLDNIHTVSRSVAPQDAVNCPNCLLEVNVIAGHGHIKPTAA